MWLYDILTVSNFLSFVEQVLSSHSISRVCLVIDRIQKRRPDQHLLTWKCALLILCIRCRYYSCSHLVMCINSKSGASLLKSCHSMSCSRLPTWIIQLSDAPSQSRHTCSHSRLRSSATLPGGRITLVPVLGAHLALLACVTRIDYESPPRSERYSHSIIQVASTERLSLRRQLAITSDCRLLPEALPRNASCGSSRSASSLFPTCNLSV